MSAEELGKRLLGEVEACGLDDVCHHFTGRYNKLSEETNDAVRIGAK